MTTARPVPTCNLEVAEQTLALTVPPEPVEAVAQRAAALVAERLDGDRSEDRWLSTRQAAEYLGLTPNALHKLTAAHQVPFAQDTRGGKCWFLRSELDSWRYGVA